MTLENLFGTHLVKKPPKKSLLTKKPATKLTGKQLLQKPFLQTTLKPKPEPAPTTLVKPAVTPSGPGSLWKSMADQTRFRQEQERERLRKAQLEQERLAQLRQITEAGEAEKARKVREAREAERLRKVREAELRRRGVDPVDSVSETVDRMNNPRPEDLDPVETVDRMNNPRPEDLNPVDTVEDTFTPVDDTGTPDPVDVLTPDTGVDPVKVNEAVDKVLNPDTVTTTDPVTETTPDTTTTATTDTTTVDAPATDTTLLDPQPGDEEMYPVLGVTPLDRQHFNSLKKLEEDLKTAGIISEAERDRLLVSLEEEYENAKARVAGERESATLDISESLATDLAKMMEELGADRTDLARSLQTDKAGIEDALATKLSELAGLEELESLRLEEAHPNEILELFDLLGRTPGSITSGLATGTRAGMVDRLQDEQAFDFADLGRRYGGQRDFAESVAEDDIAGLRREYKDSLAELRRNFDIDKTDRERRAGDAQTRMDRSANDLLASMEREYDTAETDLELGLDNINDARVLSHADAVAQLGRATRLRIQKEAEYKASGSSSSYADLLLAQQSVAVLEFMRQMMQGPQELDRASKKRFTQSLTGFGWTDPTKQGLE